MQASSRFVAQTQASGLTVGLQQTVTSPLRRPKRPLDEAQADSVDTAPADGAGEQDAEGTPEASAPDAAAAGAAMEPASDPGGDTAGRQQEVQCQMKVMTDGSTEDCDHPGVAPWLASGAGGLLLAMMSVTRGGGESKGATPAGESPSALAAPKLSTSTGTDAINNSGHVQVQLAAPERQWMYRLDGETQWRTGTGTRIDGSTLPPGLHSLVVVQVDEHGRRGDPATLAVLIDNTVAQPALALKHDTGDSPTDSVTRDGIVTVSDVETAASWWYRVDGLGEWQRGQGNEVAVDSVRQGSRTVEVYQIDAAGNRSGVAQISFQLDSLAPESPVVSTSSGKDVVGVNDVVRIDGIEAGAHWEYSANGDTAFRAVEGGELPAGVLKEGVNVVRFVQVDVAGNRSAVVERTISYDTTAPDGLALTASTSTGQINAEGEVRVAGIDPGATWFYRVNGAETWIPGTGSVVPASALTEGVNVIEAYQVDGVGLSSPRTNVSVTLDLTPPAAPDLQSSNGTDLLNANGFVNVTGLEGGATWVYRLNGQGDWIEGQGGRIPASALANGNNVIEVRQTDSAGNEGAAASLPVRVDLDAPDALAVQVEGGSAEALSLQGYMKLFNLEPGATWSYRINGEVDWHFGTGERLDAAALAEGRNVIEFRQTDTTGHESGITNLNVTRDSLAPDRPDVVTSNGLPVINASGSLLVNLLEEGAQWAYRVNGGGWVTGQGNSIGSTVLQEGDNTVEVRQTDAAGNESSIDSVAVRLDTVAPDELQSTARVRAGTAAVNDLINATGYISLDNLEAGASWEFKVNGDQYWRRGGGTQLSTRVLDEGDNTIQFRQIDAAGNVGATHSETVTLDTIAPKTPTMATSSGSQYLSGSGRIDFGDFEAGTSLIVKMNGVTVTRGWNSAGTSLQVVVAEGIRQGSNVVTTFQSDAAGNVSQTGSLSFLYDSLNPVYPEFVRNWGHDNVLNDLAESISLTNLEANASWWYRLDRGEWQRGSGNTISGSALANPPGATPTGHDIYGDFVEHRLDVYQVDQAGNSSVNNVLAFKSYIMSPPAGV